MRRGPFAPLLGSVTAAAWFTRGGVGRRARPLGLALGLGRSRAPVRGAPPPGRGALVGNMRPPWWCNTGAQRAGAAAPAQAGARPGLRSHSSSQPASDDSVAAKKFMLELGYTEDVADGVIATLEKPSSGVPAGTLEAMVKAMAGRWEIGEDAGLGSIAKAVEVELAEAKGKAVVHFTVRVPHANGREFECQGLEGMSLRDVVEHGQYPGAEELGEYLECACSGVMACSTCHVYLDDKSFEAFGGEPEDAEMDMIDLAYEPKETSRLGCQLTLRPKAEGAVVTIPGGANNMFDHIPFG